MKCFLAISNFLEVISSLSHFILFFYFFALSTEEGFLISPCCSLELCIQMGISFIFFLCLELLFFSELLARPHQTTILPFWISFPGYGLDHCFLYNVTDLPLLFFRQSVNQIYSHQSPPILLKTDVVRISFSFLKSFTTKTITML